MFTIRIIHMVDLIMDLIMDSTTALTMDSTEIDLVEQVDIMLVLLHGVEVEVPLTALVLTTIEMLKDLILVLVIIITIAE